MSLDQLPLMLTVDEAAEVLRIGRNSTYAAISEGVIPSVRIGRVIRVPRHALAEFCTVRGDASIDDSSNRTVDAGA